jgi:hypothetical protein
MITNRMSNRTKLTELTNDSLIEIAPAIGATTAYHEVSDKYRFIPTLAVVNMLRDSGWYPVMAQQANTRKPEKNGFQKHLIRFQKADLEITSAERVDLVLYNSHDRGSAFNIAASIWRQICGNGLMVASDLFSFSHRHIGFDGNSLVADSLKIANSAGEIAYQVDDMKAIELTPDEKGVYAVAAHSLIYDEPEQAPIQPAALLQERRYDDKGNNLWNTFNVVQENIMKGGVRGIKTGDNGRRKRVKTRAVKSIDKNIKLNKALWLLTEKMEELKTA